MSDLEGKVAIVTGAAGGLGREITRALVETGMRVTLCDLDADACQETADECPAEPGQLLLCPGDVTSSSDMEALVAKTVAHYGTLDCACNNAGVEGSTVPAGDMEEDDWRRVIEVNLTGVWISMKHQLKYLADADKPGSIVNMSSSTGHVGVPGIAPYVASKHGVLGLTKSAALDYAAQNIRINALCPGAMHTALIDRVLETHPETVAKLIEATPMRRFGALEDVSNAVKFLFSEQSSYMTGQSLVIDGGYIAQ